MSVTSTELENLNEDCHKLIDSGVKSEHVYQALTVIELRRMYTRMGFMGGTMDRVENELEQVNTNIRNLQE